MRHAIPRRTLLSLTLSVCFGALLPACSHTGEEERIAGYWEGTLPLPTTGEALPIAYDFHSGDGLTVTIGLGDNRTVTQWTSWEVHSETEGDLVLHIHRADGRVFATLARYTDDGGLMLWDLGTEEGTAAHVRRVERPEGAGDGSGSTGVPADGQ